MSIGLAIQNIATYTSMIHTTTSDVSDLEAQALAATMNKNDALLKDINRQLAQAKSLLGMLKDFLEFWKDTIKSVLGLFKLFGDLAKGAQ